MKIFGRIRIPRLAVVAAAIALAIHPPSAFAEKDAGMEDLDVSLGDLLNLEVSVATKTEMTQQEAPSIVSVITADEIKNMGARNIMDVLRTVPGFNITHSMLSPVHVINVRGIRSGLDNNKVKIMINGHSMQASYGSLYVHTDNIPIENIRQIEIIRGPGSALYGTGAFIGVVNIVTREGGDGPSEVTLEGGSDNTIKPHARLSYKKDEFKLSLCANYHDTDGSGETLESDAATNSPVLAGNTPGEMTGDVRYYTFQADAKHGNFYFSGFFQDVRTESPVGVASVLTDEDDMHQQYAYGDLGYKLPVGDKGSVLLRAYYDYAYFDNYYEIFPEETAEMDMHTGFPPGEGIYGDPQAKQSVAGGEFMADYEVWPGIELVSGISYEYFKHWDPNHYANANVTFAPLEVDGVTYPGLPFQYLGGMADISENGNFMPDEVDRTVFALYGQGIIDLKDLFSLEKGVRSLTFTAGVRYDDYDDVGSTTNPRFGLVYAPSDDLHFKALYSTAFRAPDFRELHMMNNPASVANPNLKPEEISTAEVLVGYNFTERISGNLTLFHIEADELIGTQGIFTENIGSREVRGAEAEIKVRFGKLRYAYVNATYQDAKDTTGNVITSDGGQTYVQEDFGTGENPEFIANLGVNYDIFDFMISNVSLTYMGEIERREEKMWAGENLVNADTRDSIDDCLLVNASLTFGNFHKAMEVQISGFNIFDANHRYPDASGALPDDMPSVDRGFMGRISYSF